MTPSVKSGRTCTLFQKHLYRGPHSHEKGTFSNRIMAPVRGFQMQVIQSGYTFEKVLPHLRAVANFR